MKDDKRQVFYGQVNHARYRGQPQGHYESFFQRANHPSRPLAFWVRYTLFSPALHPGDAIGELWAVFFNGETRKHVVVKKELPLSECLFDTTRLHVRVGNAELSERSLSGEARTGKDSIAWDLSYKGGSKPVLLLPFPLYSTKLPAAKSLVGVPMAQYIGRLAVNGEIVDVTDWVGSQNHNWGLRHTDLYAWGQVAGFDTHPESFLELATAKLRVGSLWTPPITPIVLRHRGREHALNGLFQAVKAHGRFDYFSWNFASQTREVSLKGTIVARRDAFVGLNYYNPPGGNKHCLNTKIAACSLRFEDKASGTVEVLETKNRAAFEILTDDREHGISIAV
jgi:hypothetical protein